MSKTVTIPSELNDRLYEALQGQIHYQIYDCGCVVDYAFETLAYLDLLDVLGYDTAEWRDEFWNYLVDPSLQRDKAENSIMDRANNYAIGGDEPDPDFKAFYDTFIAKRNLFDCKESVRDYALNELGLDTVPEGIDYAEIIKKFTALEGLSECSDNDLWFSVIETYFAEIGYGRS